MSKRKTTKLPSEKSAESPMLVVGIGASAGGVEALTHFFANVPPDSGLAYVVILHLSPDYDSQLTQILQNATEMPVTQVMEPVEVEANKVYVVPPDKHLLMANQTIVVQPNARVEDRRAPVDIFFRTLAESQGARAVAVVLSGTGANGSMGLKRVKEKGGAVFVQNPREATFNEMPRNAIATDLIDDILPVADIPARLVAYQQGLGTVIISEEAPQRSEDQQQALREVFTQLRLRTGHDFSNYKRSTLLRRLERRINVHNLSSLPAYAIYLREHPDEAHALLKDLLISVTNFFRDDKVFTAIEQSVIPVLTRPANGKESVRIWVAGCATGEEAYTLAILCAERTLGVIDAPNVQIFATDIDVDAIATAREGLYTLNDAADVSPDRLRRFFTPEGQQYRVRREIREMILFAQHNVLKDPPFSQLDLISCRNLLIYLNPIAQERIIETFHFALKPGGHLLLGVSETVDGSGDLFATVDRENHLYQSRRVLARPYPIPEGIPQSPSERKPPPDPARQQESRPTARVSYGGLHQQLLEQYAPPSLIVNEEYDLLHSSERAGRYLQIGGGEPSKNVLKLIRPELRLELRTALYQATQQQVNVEIPQLAVDVGDRVETITLHVRPVMREGDPARGFVLVLFEYTGNEATGAQPVLTPVEPMAQQLEEELIRAKIQLRSSNEQHELQAEELKATNEELQAMNEELRSAAEELETGKEEVQSINEELTTVNQELKVKIEEASLVSNNLQNLINSTDIATLFLDRAFRVNLFTPATRQLFNLIPFDIGRPLTDITNRLDYPHLQADAEAVLSTLQPVEREVQTTDGHVYIMRVLPYRTAEDRINGVVLTFVDITDRKIIEESLAKSEEKYRTLFNSLDEGVTTLELIFDENERVNDFRYLEHNPALIRQTGLTNAIIGKRAKEIFPDLEAYWFETHERVVKTGKSERAEYYFVTLDSWFDLFVSRVGGEGSRTVVCVYNNITERKRIERNLAFLAEVSQELTRMTNIDETMDALCSKISQYFGASICAFSEVNEAQQLISVAHESKRQNVRSFIGTHYIADFHTKDFRRAMRAGEVYVIRDAAVDPRANAELMAVHSIGAFVSVPLVRDGEWRFALSIADQAAHNWREDEIDLLSEMTDRIWTRLERARAEEVLRETEARLASIRPLTLLGQTEDLARIGSWEYHRPTGHFRWSDGLYRLFGLEPGHVVQPHIYINVAVQNDRDKAQDLVMYLNEGEGVMETELRIRVGEVIKTLQIKAEVLGEGDQLRVLGVDLDITEQLLAQEQIRETATNLQAVLNTSPASIGLLKAVRDPVRPGHILDFQLAVGNDKLAEFFGQPLNELLGQSAERFISLLWDGQTLNNLRQVYNEDEYRYEERPLPAPHQDRWLALAVMRQGDGIVLTGLDITQLKHIQAQQQHWLSELEASRYSVDMLAEMRTALLERTELLRNVSHDLRGNFSVIEGGLQLVGMADSEADRAQIMEMVIRNVRQATSLLTDLLDLSRLESGQQSLTLESFDASALFQELGQSLQPIAQEQSLVLTLSGPDAMVVENDRKQVYRMVQNLTINAIKYTHAGSVMVRWGQDEDRWWFSVTDTGPGLPSDVIALFKAVETTGDNPVQEVTQARSDEARYANNYWGKSSGEGIGLRIVRELAHLLDAQIRVNSEVNVGTNLRVSFPIRYKKEAD